MKGGYITGRLERVVHESTLRGFTLDSIGTGDYRDSMRITTSVFSKPTGFVVLSLALYLAVSIAQETNAGAAFSQLTCPAGGTVANFTINAANFDQKEDWSGRYQNGQTSPWTLIVTNSNVAGLRPYFKSFMVEWYNDYFGFNDATGYWTLTGTYCDYASCPPSYLSPNIITMINGGAFKGAWYNWNTSASTSYEPPLMYGAQVICSSSQTTTATNGVDFGNTGATAEMLLIGTSDTIYANFRQPAGSKGMVILTHKGYPTDGDADLYLSSTYPTLDGASPGVLHSWRVGDDEIDLPLTTTQKSWYVAVHSSLGAPHVVLDVKFQNPAASIPMTVRTEFSLTDSDRAKIVQFLQIATLRMLSATDGAVRLGPFDVYPNPGVGCDAMASDICLSDPLLDPDGRVMYFASSDVGDDCKNRKATFSRSLWTGDYVDGTITFVHEMGHACFGFGRYSDGDTEYGAGLLPLCGHSVMANDRIAGYCSRRHCLDGEGYDPNRCNPNEISNWTWMKQQTKVPLTWATNWPASGTDPRRMDYARNAIATTVTFH